MVAVALFFSISSAQSAPESVDLAKGGKALVPITISPASSEDLKATAGQFAEILSRITGAELTLEEGTEPRGTPVFDGKIVGGALRFPVSASEAGQVWRLSGEVQNLWLFDIPTILSPNPEFLFVPAQIAKTDHMKIAL